MEEWSVCFLGPFKIYQESGPLVAPREMYVPEGSSAEWGDNQTSVQGLLEMPKEREFQKDA